MSIYVCSSKQSLALKAGVIVLFMLLHQPIHAAAKQEVSGYSNSRLQDISAAYSSPCRHTYDFSQSHIPGSNIFWMSFPVVDEERMIYGNPMNMLGCLLDKYLQFAPAAAQLFTASWNYKQSRGNLYYSMEMWCYDDYLATPSKGFKLRFNPGQVDTLVVTGKRSDPNTTPVELYTRNPQKSNLRSDECWIGYFVPFTQGVGDAFSRVVSGDKQESYLDYIYQIKSQTWCTARVYPEFGSPWITNPNTYTLSEGEMVSIKLLPDAPEKMYWNTLSNARMPATRELPQNFSYIEKLDYTPLFIEFDPNDLPEEVGIYVSGVCQGAAVVDSTLIEVNYYATEAKNDSDIEIMFYYGEKGMKKAPAAYVYNPETMLFEAGSLKTSQLGEYGYISFNRSEGSSLVPLVTELKQNYPNPFKGETNISWVLGKDAPISVDVYNLRGQKVKTLFNGIGKKGRQYLNWDAKDSTGQKVASGVYFYRLNSPDGTKVQKMLVLK